MGGHAYGAQPRVTESRLSNLLQQPTVSAIYRDKSGILWIGTQQGLHRFDGANLTVFDSDRSNQYWIPESEIRDITEDSTGNILVVTSGGVLLKFNQQTESFDAIKTFAPVERTNLVRLIASKHNSTWLLSRDGLFLFDAKFQSTADWVTNLNLANTIGRLHDFLEDESGNLWVAGTLGLGKVTPQSKSFVAFDLETLGLSKNSRLTALEVNSESNLIVGTDTGQLVAWDTHTSTSLATASIGGNSANYVSDFVMYGDLLVIATDRGLFASDNHLSYVKSLDDKGGGLSNPDVYSLLRDGKYVWVGTIDGLDILSFSPFELFNLKNSGVSNDTLAFEEDREGRVWVGTYSGLYRFSETINSHSSYGLDISATDNQIVTTIAARGSELWLGFLRGGIQVVNTDVGSVRSLNLTNSTSSNTLAITKLLISNHNQDIWIATYDHGLFRITAAGTVSYFENQTLPEKTITLIFQAKADVLAVSENRVYRYHFHTDQFRHIEFDFSLGGKKPLIYSIKQSSNDDILIGTKDHGLFIWSRENQINNQFLLIPILEKTLSTSTIYGIEQDSKANLWCSTQYGIVKLDSKGHLIKRFTTADGLQSNDFALGASFTSRDGLIYFGGVNGYNRFDPNEVDIDSSPSPIRLAGISFPKQDERIIGDADKLESLQLTHRDYFVTFQFSVLDFISPERHQFRYKLENFDPYWIENGTRNTATYTNLPSGEYVLQVQGANSAGIWNRDGISLPVSVLPPPWLTWWAYSIYSMFILFVVWSAHRIYHSYVVDKETSRLTTQMFEAANKADDDMQEQLELQDDLIHSAYQHQLTTLSMVGDVISQQSSKQPNEGICSFANNSLKRVAALTILEDCLYYQSGVSVANLHKYTEDILPVILNGSALKPETVVTINEITSALLPAELATPLSIIIYELLENCIQHAFEPESPANYIHLKLLPNAIYAADTFDLSIHDSGVGLPDTIENLVFEGSGISVVQSIVQKLGGTLQSSGATGTTGTTVSMTFPKFDEADIRDNQVRPT